MNPYLKDMNKIEFVVTNACSGCCKHCSEGNHPSRGEHISPELASDAVRKIVSEYDIKTVMAFGGEPLLYPEAVYSIMYASSEMKVPHRQIITNGYFSRNADKIREVAQQLANCGVNDLLLSVDTFHQETIPLDIVKQFAIEAQKHGIPVRLHPAWLVSSTDTNPYNQKTQEILDSFADTSLKTGNGNIIFPEGNAVKYLSEYFKNDFVENPYTEDPYNVRCISFSSNGDVLGSNAYQHDISDILASYRP